MIAAIIYVLPTINPSFWPHKKINLGLDLQGGMHLALEVETDKAVEGTIERIIQEIRDFLRKDHIRYTTLNRIEGNRILIKLKGQQYIDEFEKILDKEFKNLRILSRSMDGDVLTMQIDLPDKETEQIKKLATDQALETIRNRIDQFGVSEPDIRRQGEKRILVQLPGIKDTKRAKALIGKTALLEFKLLDETHDLSDAVKGNVPPGSEVLYGIKVDPTTHRTYKTPYLLKKRTLLTGANLTDARVQIDSQYNEPYVSIDFDKKGGRDFERITGENVKKRLAIVLDNKVYSAPVIQEKISGGKARITGHFTTEEARDLAIALRAGALPAPVDIVEERTVGPSLGTDSIRKGLISMCVGGLLVVLFMIVYYRGSGLIADFALVLNILLIAGGLAGFQATLTLPGIAGIILTIGMAVDANILVFERMKEELRAGRSLSAAIEAGFSRAWTSIRDSNISTLITCGILFYFGSTFGAGAVRGFAITLALGVVINMFTAIIVTRTFMRLVFGWLGEKVESNKFLMGI